MSDKNVEIARRVADAFNRADVEAVLADMDPDVEFIPRRAPVQGSFHGHQGIRDFFADNDENFDVFEMTVAEVRDHGDKVSATGVLRTRGKQSGVETEVSEIVVLTFRNDKVVRFEDFSDRPDDLAALGLSGPED